MWQPLNVHSHYSMLLSASKPEDIVKEVVRKGYRACGLTDYGSMSGSVDFSIAATEAKIKPILGSEIYICEQDSSIKDASNRSLSHLVVLARNKVGYSNLCKLTTRSWENMYHKPRLSLDEFLEFSEGLIVINGHPGSHLHKCILNHDLDYAKKQANKMFDILGENFFVEISLVDNSESSLEIGKTMRDITKSIGCNKVANCDSHYTNKSLSIDQQIILCINTKTTLKDVKEKIEKLDSEDGSLSGFFKTDGFDIPELSRMKSLHEDYEDELENSELIVDMVEDYTILSSPKTPRFTCPNNMSEKDYLLQLCREGWKKRSKKIAKEKNPIYVDRINKELTVFNNAGLEGYFLIVQDYVNWSKSQGHLVGSGRGSGAGSLASYLLGITEVDPIPYNLMFERFYNAGRNTSTHVSMPDIDVDFPSYAKESVIDYISNKYGKYNTAKICTWGTLQAKAVISDVLRMYGIDFTTIKNISKLLPNKLDIEDSMKEQEEKSALNWTIKNEPKILSEWVKIDDSGKLIGDFASYFEQAIRLEGTVKSLGQHAAGVVITSEPINDICPMIQSKEGSVITGYEMSAVEAIGCVKFDILTVEALDVLQEYNRIVESL